MGNNNLHLVVVPPSIEELSDADPPEITHATMVKSGNVLIVHADGSSVNMDPMDMLDMAYQKLRADNSKSADFTRTKSSPKKG